MSALTEETHFRELADAVCRPLAGCERVTLHLAAEDSSFLRFNRARVRQATQVSQGIATLSLVAGRRRLRANLTLGGDAAADRARLLAERDALLAELPQVREDPWLLLPDTVQDSRHEARGALPAAAQVIDAVERAAAAHDFVGFHAGGPVVRAFADSRGQRNWHRVESFHFDWCLYHPGGAHDAALRDKAVKSSYAGAAWDEGEFARRVAEGAVRLPLLAQPARPLAPGPYRAWLEPAAVGELLGAMSWGGFGLKDRRTGVSPLTRLERGELALDPRVSLTEATARGGTPAFTEDGFARPAEVRLVEAGRAADTLASPRSAREYGVAANGACDEETPQALVLAPGTLPASRTLEALGTGLWISNLWYLNYSDRPNGRVTGMTRFACFRVEDGRLVAPLPVMRFDDSLLRLFGPGLVELGAEPGLQPDPHTYGQRLLASVTTPGLLVEGLRLVL
ncbi:metallopeptidase TldD-related protein [Caldimonas tepidiphila]|uniref:metallopeptidase TldD-related protein n=1 Tax=Caldimonas tepidiphila TaxID=2315841 RepID=UPI000E5A107A|nr:metallopeptidase TldD-related protein [Caldimonas tepidiphila]